MFWRDLIGFPSKPRELRQGRDNVKSVIERRLGISTLYGASA